MSSLSVGVIGSGPAGLVTAHTLVKDGFKVQILTRDSSPGGVWAAERVYPGVALNTAHGQFSFSSLPMPPSKHAELTGRLSGEDLRAYMESFTDRFLKPVIRYHADVLNISRPDGNPDAEGWVVTIKDTQSGQEEKIFYDKIVVCTGGYSEAAIPKVLKEESVRFKGSVSHSSEFREKLPEILAVTKPVTDDKPGHVVVVGCGKSAQDISAYIANQNRKVTVVFETADAAIARPKPLPPFIRKGRWVSVFAPHKNLRTRLERFLHTTWLGAIIVRKFWQGLVNLTWKTLKIDENSPLRNSRPLYWGLTQNDEGTGIDTAFHAMVSKGKIELVAPTKVASFGEDGRTISTSDGRILEADAVILCTGFHSSWNKIFDQSTIENIGLSRQPVPSQIMAAANRKWNYPTLANPPPYEDDPNFKVPMFHRGMIPAKSMFKRDFAVNGGFFSTNNGYTMELSSHWISSFFLNDKFLKLPPTPEAAIEEAQMHGAWMKKRHPDTSLWPSESCGSNFVTHSWPQFCDDLLEDMNLPYQRSGGGFFNWVLQVVQIEELKNLTEERQAKRQETAKSS